MVPAVQWQYHTCDCLICALVSESEALKLVKRSKGGGISATSVNNSAGLSILQTEVILPCFIVLAAVPQPDVTGVDEQPAVSSLCCTEWMWPSN